MTPRSHPKLPSRIVIALLATVALLVMVWSAWRIVVQPDLGALWTGSGDVYFAKSGADLQVGDRLTAIDDLPLAETVFPYYYWEKGDVIRVGIERDGETLLLEIPYIDPAPPFILASRLSMMVVVLALWGIGTSIALFSASAGKQSLLFFLWCQTLGVSLALGNVTSEAWSAHLSHVLTWWVITFAVHFHLLFPINRTVSGSSSVFYLIYGLPFLGTVRLLTASGILNLPEAVSAFYGLAFYIWILAGLVTVLALLVKSYQEASSTAVKQQIGLVVIFGFVAFTPLLTLSILPELLLNVTVLSPEWAFLFLIAIPIGYGYAITQYHFIELERYVSRSATAVLVICVLCLFYFGITALLQFAFQEQLIMNPTLDVAIIMILVVAFNPLRWRLQNQVDYLLYGGWYDYPSVVGEVTQALEKPTDVELLIEILSNSIQKSMRVYWACLLWQGRRTERSIVATVGNPDMPFTDLQLSKLRNIADYLQTSARPTTSLDILRAIGGKGLTAEEKDILGYPTVRLWVAIRGLQNSMGVLILGPKYGGDLFEASDMEILDVVSRQASIAFQNVQLIDELKAKAYENEQFQKEILRAREEERKHISRELHDLVIQALVGLKYQIANIQSAVGITHLGRENNQKVVELQEGIADLIQTTRNVCQDLRPAALDLGLIPSIRSILSRFEMDTGTEVMLVVEGERSIAISEDIALCIFRCTGEALSNIRKHAAAEKITVQLCIETDKINLSITDDGRGFDLPERLGSFMEQNHFGLVSMRERVELVGGLFTIESHPAEGTELKVSVPLAANH